MKKCSSCGQFIDDYATICPYCRTQQPPVYAPGGQYGHNEPPQPNTPYGGRRYTDPYDHSFGAWEARNDCFEECPEGKSRGLTALLAIFFGYFGVQYFYLGKISGGLLTILLSLVTCGIWNLLMFIQGIMLLCMDNRTFYNKFVASNSTLPLF